MPRHADVPEALRHGPFTLAQAQTLGITPRQLRGKSWVRVSRGWYRWAGLTADGRLQLTPLAASMPPGSAFCGLTAARLQGLDVPDPDRPEIVVPDHCTVARRADARVHKAKLAPGDVVWRDGVPVTSPLRTCFDLAGRMPLVEAVVLVDMALHSGLIGPAQFKSYVGKRRGVAGVESARRVLGLAEPKSESPMETRLRLLLLRAGLPRPSAQVEIRDGRGFFAGRPDLYYPDAKLGIEYDGENHRSRLIADNRRQNRLHGLGIMLLRYTGADLRERPSAIVSEVREALTRQAAQGHRPGP